MELNFLCPKCGQTITDKDFDQSEQSLKHLHEFFKSKENAFKETLKQELAETFEKQKAAELAALKSAIESQQIKKITDLENSLENLKKLSADKIALVEKDVENKYIQEVANLNQQIELLKSESKSQVEIVQQTVENKFVKEVSELKATIEKIKLQNKSELQQVENQLNLKNQELINSKSMEIEQLKNELANMMTKNQLVTNQIIEEKRLEFEKIHAADALKIKELEDANLLNKVIQNKVKGENFEHDVEGELRKVFTEDIIEKITDGKQKADYRQIVRHNSVPVGKFIYEVKNAEWKNAWEKKLTEDMAREESKYGVLVATSFNDQYRGIPFKVSDQNPNIFLTDADSFPFVGNIVRILIKTEATLLSKYKNNDQSEKLKEFHNWRDNTFKVVSRTFEDQFKRVEDSEKAIINKVDEIRIAREKISGQWLKVVKTFIEGLNL